MLYVNINGQTRKLWDEICECVKQEEADVLCLTETHWLEGGRARILPGFTRFTRGRDPQDRRGRGVAMFVRHGLKSVEWHLEDESACAYKERLWVTIVSGEEHLTVGVVYFSLDKYSEWNDNLSKVISADVSRLQSEKGNATLLVGDFNAHISEEDGGVVGCGATTNRNGRMLLDFAETAGMSILNTQRVCEGKWTRMRGVNQPSILDYALIDEQHSYRVQRMKIDDEGLGLADATDHSWISMHLSLKIRRASHTPQPRENWRIGPKTNWPLFRGVLQKKLALWSDEFGNISEDSEVVDGAYRELVSVIVQAGEEVVGWGSRPTSKLPRQTRRIRSLIKRRNLCGRSWRRASKSSTPHVVKLWDTYLQHMAEVSKAKAVAEKARKNKWVQTLIKEGGDCARKIWKKLTSDKSEE